jgi:hypothetical protein
VESPADSGIRTTGGELMGVATKRTVINERIERDVREEFCTYYEQYPVVVCNGRYGGYDDYDRYDHHGGEHCYTRWGDRPRTGRHTVEITTRIRDYEVTGSLSEPPWAKWPTVAPRIRTSRRTPASTAPLPSWR